MQLSRSVAVIEAAAIVERERESLNYSLARNDNNSNNRTSGQGRKEAAATAAAFQGPSFGSFDVASFFLSFLPEFILLSLLDSEWTKSKSYARKTRSPFHKL